MLFNSLSFLIFFPCVFLLYWVLPARMRPLLLLAASCFFYMSFVPYYILILLYLIILDYVLARCIEKAEGKKRLAYFFISIASTVAILVVFKYFNFFNENLASLAQALSWNYSLQTLSLLLPLGLSFHVFQSLAYVIEVYKGHYRAEKNILTYALYVLFFPQLVAGPIERPAHLLPQLKTTQTFNYDTTVSGLQQMLWGFFKKLVIGNNLAVCVDFIYTNAHTADASVLLLATIAFAFLLYADFSGYSDIAIGSARMLGIHLSPNFRQPYFSQSTGELWRRWHISLSSWFRDYVYIPLGGNRVGLLRQCANTTVIFALMGIWHGAGWNFIVMGLLFGFYICFGLVTKPWRTKLYTSLGVHDTHVATILLRVGTTFALTALAWVFFRAESLSQALTVLYRLFTQWSTSSFSYLTCSNYCAFYQIGIGRGTLFVVALSILALLAYDLYKELQPTLPTFLRRRLVRWTLYYVLVLWIIFAGHFAPKTFIYFQF